VLLRLDRGGDPPAEALQDAAALAQHHSDARHEDACDVEWTLVKHLRRGSRPGQVYVARGRTIRVHRDAARLARLLADHSTATRLVETLTSNED
jgi:predicted ribosome quality control (RQC) complex YloA/Tae2 family protein